MLNRDNKKSIVHVLKEAEDIFREFSSGCSENIRNFAWYEGIDDSDCHGSPFRINSFYYGFEKGNKKLLLDCFDFERDSIKKSRGIFSNSILVFKDYNQNNPLVKDFIESIGEKGVNFRMNSNSRGNINFFTRGFIDKKTLYSVLDNNSELYFYSGSCLKYHFIKNKTSIISASLMDNESFEIRGSYSNFDNLDPTKASFMTKIGIKSSQEFKDVLDINDFLNK